MNKSSFRRGTALAIAAAVTLAACGGSGDGSSRQRNAALQVSNVAVVRAAMIDGGFEMGMNLPIFAPGTAPEGEGADQSVTTATGQQIVIPSTTSFGSISAGGLY